MAAAYENSGPIDCTIQPALSVLKEKNVVITGGSSGLGAAYVKAFLDAGYTHHPPSLEVPHIYLKELRAYVTNVDLQPPSETPENDK